MEKKQAQDFNDEAKRFSVVEYGDPLKVFRLPGREPTQQYFSLGCTQYDGLDGQHSVANLASCLTDIAANANDEMASKLIIELGIKKSH